MKNITLILLTMFGLLLASCVEVVEVGEMPGGKEKKEKTKTTSTTQTPKRNVTYAKECIKYDDMVLLGVNLKDSEERVIRNLGKPFKTRTKNEQGEDGSYQNKTLYYNNIEVEIVWGEVTRILTRSDKAVLPGGVKVGMEYAAVMKEMSKSLAEQETEAKFVSFENCDENLLTHTSYLNLEFNLRNQLTTIEITTIRP